jgi:hypothetical protein
VARERFNDQEWDTLTKSPAWAWALPAALDGNIDKLETSILDEALNAYRSDANPLVREVFTAFDSDVFRAARDDPRPWAGGLGQVVFILEMKAGFPDSTAFTSALASIAFSVATRGTWDSKQMTEKASEGYAAALQALRIPHREPRPDSDPQP